MNLEHLCQPLFDYMCQLYRFNENRAALTLEDTRNDILKIMDKMRDCALGDSVMTDQLSKVELPLIFFVDYIIKEGPFTFRDQWKELAHGYNELSGDEKFFDILDETLNDPTPSATERIGVYFTCMALGFNGCYFNDPKFVEKRMKVCALRLGISGDETSIGEISENIESTVNTNSQFKDPQKNAKRLFWFTLIFLLGAIITNVILFHLATGSIQNQFTAILESIDSSNRNPIPRSIQVEEEYKKNNKVSTDDVPKLNATELPSFKYDRTEMENAVWKQAYDAGTSLKTDFDYDRSAKKKTDDGGSKESDHKKTKSESK